jgi:hypothetical protein
MYSAFLCRFVGGPVDGELRMVRGEHGAPAPLYEVRVLVASAPGWRGPLYSSVVYLCRPDLDGRWFYEYQPPKEGIDAASDVPG